MNKIKLTLAAFILVGIVLCVVAAFRTGDDNRLLALATPWTAFWTILTVIYIAWSRRR